MLGHPGGSQLLDIDEQQAREDLARASVMSLSFVAQSARGLGLPMVPQSEIDKASTIVERFMIRWRGEPDPAHVKAVDAYFTSAAEHGLNASTFTARIVASTGADVAACLSSAIGALSGPLHGGAPARVLSIWTTSSARNASPGEARPRPRDPSLASATHLRARTARIESPSTGTACSAVQLQNS